MAMTRLTLTVSTTGHSIAMNATDEQIRMIVADLTNGCDLDITVDADGKPIHAMVYVKLPPVLNQHDEPNSDYVPLLIRKKNEEQP